MIKPNEKIEPLREDLSKLIPNRFFTTTPYKRWIVSNNLQRLWKQCLDSAEKERPYIVSSDYQSIEAGDAVTLMLNYFYEQQDHRFSLLVIELLKLYIHETKEELDVTDLRQDFVIAGIDEVHLAELDKLSVKKEMESSNEKSLTAEQRIRRLEEIYVGTLQTSPNNRDSINAYHEWFTQTLLYLDDYYSITNPDFAKFKNTDNNHNGLGLKDNYYSLKAIYNLLMKNAFKQINYNQPQKKKTPMVFISHSSEDKSFVDALVDLLEGLGLSDENLFCSSVEGYGIPLGGDIIETLRELFTERELFVVFIHSPRYYKSLYSLNEMGAAWALRTNFCSILTADMEYQEMKAVVNDRTVAIKVNTDNAEFRLNEFKDKIIEMFGLIPVDGTRWERKRRIFLERVNHIVYA